MCRADLLVRNFLDERSFSSFVSDDKFKVNQVFSVHSLDNNSIVALVELINKEDTNFGQKNYIFKIKRIIDHQLVLPGQKIRPLDLNKENFDYPGSTQLLVKNYQKESSSRYKPLYTQGVLIGETAETLDKDEFLANILGQFNYGLYDDFTIGTTAPVNAAGGLSFSTKYRILTNASNSISTLLTFTRVPESTQSNLNFTFLWDSYSNDKMITHNFFSLAVLAWDKSNETTAIKNFGSSSIQTGYEFILRSWDRILVGPNYNLEKKTIGGYFSYVFIWDRIHFHLSLNSLDLRSRQWSYSEGYYAFFDLYWRY